MAATIKIYDYTGAAPGSGAVVEGANDVVRLRLADNNLKNTDDPNIPPDSGVHYSVKKTIALECTDAPNTGINNCRMWLDDALDWTDCIINVGDQQSDVYEQGIINPGDAESGQELTEYAEISSVTNLNDYNSGSPLVLDLSSAWGNTTGRITKYLCIQLKLGPSAIEAVQALEGLTFKVDET